MDFNLDKIKKLAINSLLVKNPKVSFLADGYGNFNFLIKENDNKFVLRLKKSDEKQFVYSLEKEYIFLKYFEKKNIDFCPKALFYDKKNNFLIEKFIKGERVSTKNFSNKQIDLFAKQLHKLFILNVSDFFNFCEKNKLKKIKIITPVELLKKYGFNRFNETKKGDIPKNLSDWIKIKLDENLKYLSSRKVNFEKMGFCWGDIQSNVIIDNSGKMNFYDFEHTGIMDDCGLVYIKIHGKFNKRQFNYLIDRYCFYSKKNKSDIL
ncbi:MAG: hypothetical protein U9O66_03775, partial [Patescibacteria group bacterium]|nr:hypothetical protein [Patescibacteria group bacterium]